MTALSRTSKNFLHTVAALSLLGAVSSLLANSAQAADAMPPGKVFKDCKDCPEMVVLPAGTFTMGTPDDEPGRQPDEGPQHQVTFAKPFAISRFQVLAGEFDTYQRETGVKLEDFDVRPGRHCSNGKPSYPQSPRQPAVCLNLADAQAYIAWLSKKTGKHYRLISEAAREYGARGGSTGPFPFPFEDGETYQIFSHANTYGPRDGYTYTNPAGAYPPNAFGVYDMHGNVSEWIADCAHKDYVGAPSDGSAWVEKDCKLQGIRGNDYIEAPIFSRSGNRNDMYPNERGDWLGFRVERDL